MNKRFEQEYREMIENDVPDLWNRIEKGVNESPRANNVITFDGKVRVPDKKKELKKSIINNYQLKALAGVAVCFILLMAGLPTVRKSMEAEKNAEEAGRDAIAKQEITINEDTAKENSSETENKAKENLTGSSAVEPKAENLTEENKTEAGKDNTASDAANDEASKSQEEPAETAPTATAADIKAQATVADTTQHIEDKTGNGDSLQPAQEKPAYIVETKAPESSSVKAAKPTLTEEEKAARAAKSSSEKALREAKSSSAKAVREAKSSSAKAAREAKSSSVKAEKEAKSSSKKAKASSSAPTPAQAPVIPVTPVAEAESDGNANSEVTQEPVAGTSNEAAGSETPEIVNYSGVQIKVKKASGKDADAVYTVKIVEDPTGSFSKGKSIKVRYAGGLEKGGSYVIAFIKDGTKTSGGKTLYTVVDASRLGMETAE